MPDLLDRLRALPGGARLLAAAADGPPAHLVGGAVRDLLLGREPAELDVVVEGPVDGLAAALDGEERARHDRFGTVTVVADGVRYDLARARAERYPRPGALPEVRPAPLDADLGRRDVTVNALALDLRDGRLRGAGPAEEDLRAGRLRVLHDASFRDDPTRLWRLARYAARLGFTIEPHTERLAREAVAAGAPDTVSGARIGNELRLALREADPVAALEAAAGLGLAPWLAPDRARAEAALALLPEGEGRRDLVVLAAAVRPGGPVPDLDALGFPAGDRRIVAAALDPPAPAGERPSELLAAFGGAPVEAVALSPDRAAAARWLGGLRQVRPAIGGGDLLAAGVPAGPEVGRRLRAVHAALLDGELPADRDAQLAAALR